VWRRFDEEELIADIWTMKPDGTELQQITSFSSMSWAPYTHPSGEYILLATNKLGFANFEFFMVDFEGTKEPVRITLPTASMGFPCLRRTGPGSHGRQTAMVVAAGRSILQAGTTKRRSMR